MKTVSVYQKVARGMITVMLAGAIVTLVGYGIITVQMITARVVDDSFSKIVYAATPYLTSVSFLLEFLGIFVWSMLLMPFFPTLFPLEDGSGRKVRLGDSISFNADPGPVILIALMLAVLIALLWFSRYLTKTKGARTSCAVFLGLVLVDLPMSPVLYAIQSDSFRTAGMYINLAVHLFTAVMLILSLRHIAENREAYTDFTDPKGKGETVAASEIAAGSAPVTSEGWAVSENALTRAVGDRERRGSAKAARVIVVLLIVFTLTFTVTEYIQAAVIHIKGSSYIETAFYGVAQPIETVTGFCGDVLTAFFSTVLANFSFQGEIDWKLLIVSAITVLAMPTAMLWAQRYFTKKQLSRPALVMALTVTVIGTMPYLSPLIMLIPGAALHGVLIGLLIAAIRRTE
jgi:hypothetical protein